MNDYDVSIFILTKDNQYIVPEECDRDQENDGEFICVTNERLNPDFGTNNSIFIYRDWISALSMAQVTLQIGINKCDTVGYIKSMWQTVDFPIKRKIGMNRSLDWGGGFKSVPDRQALPFLNGYDDSKNIMLDVPSNLDKDECIPVIMLAYHTVVEFNDKQYHGYLPSIGQWVYISRNIKRINDTLDMINGDLFPYGNAHLELTWWSSTEIDEDHVLDMRGNQVMQSIKNHKSYVWYVLPLHLIR